MGLLLTEERDELAHVREHPSSRALPSLDGPAVATDRVDDERERRRLDGPAEVVEAPEAVDCLLMEAELRGRRRAVVPEPRLVRAQLAALAEAVETLALELGILPEEGAQARPRLVVRRIERNDPGAGMGGMEGGRDGRRDGARDGGRDGGRKGARKR